MTFARGDKVWWHNPVRPTDDVHHGWIETVEPDGLGVAEVGVATQVVPVVYVHANEDQPPVPTCAFCTTSETTEGAT
jgi:hypothetical protein